MNCKFRSLLLKYQSILGLTESEVYYNKWKGCKLCGPSCVIASIILMKDYSFKVFMNKRGFGEIYEDHVFICINDLIIDPTYKQFLKENNDMQDFFIGRSSELEIIMKNYGAIDQNMRHWSRDIDITDKVLNFIEENITPL